RGDHPPHLRILIEDSQAIYPIVIDPLVSQFPPFTASDGATQDEFGTSVALDGNTALIGAPLKTIGGNTNQGAAYVIVRSSWCWTQQQRLTANDGATDDWFGASVALDTDTVLIGAQAKTIGSNSHQGAAYVFVRSNGGWIQQPRLTAS